MLKISKFDERAKRIFEYHLKKNSRHSSTLLDFTAIIEVSFEIKLFPLVVNKKSLRFMYLYCRSQEEGVRLSEFMDIWLLCALIHCPYGEVDQKIKWISDHLNRHQ